ARTREPRITIRECKQRTQRAITQNRETLHYFQETFKISGDWALKSRFILKASLRRPKSKTCGSIAPAATPSTFRDFAGAACWTISGPNSDVGHFVAGTAEGISARARDIPRRRRNSIAARTNGRRAIRDFPVRRWHIGAIQSGRPPGSCCKPTITRR